MITGSCLFVINYIMGSSMGVQIVLLIVALIGVCAYLYSNRLKRKLERFKKIGDMQ